MRFDHSYALTELQVGVVQAKWRLVSERGKCNALHTSWC